MATPLERPIAVGYRGRRFNLSAEDAEIHADVDGMVDAALRASRDGNIISRVARDLTGGEEDEAISASVTYSDEAVNGLVRAREGRRSTARPRTPRSTSPRSRRSRRSPGISVKAGLLSERLEGALVSTSERRVRAPVRVTQPKVTRDELAEEYPVVLVAERYAFKLHLYKQLKLVKSYTVAVGALGFDTPAGLYHIQNKAVDPGLERAQLRLGGRPRRHGGARAACPRTRSRSAGSGIFDGAGIHGTDQTYSLGTAASHGCIRMGIPDVIELYDQVPVGTPIYIA